MGGRAPNCGLSRGYRARGQDAAYVEYSGKVDKAEHELLIGRLNEEAARLIAAGAEVGG